MKEGSLVGEGRRVPLYAVVLATGIGARSAAISDGSLIE